MKTCFKCGRVIEDFETVCESCSKEHDDEEQDEFDEEMAEERNREHYQKDDPSEAEAQENFEN